MHWYSIFLTFISKFTASLCSLPANTKNRESTRSWTDESISLSLGSLVLEAEIIEGVGK